MRLKKEWQLFEQKLCDNGRMKKQDEGAEHRESSFRTEHEEEKQ